MTAGIHAVFRGSKFFSNAGVGEINRNLNIKLHLFLHLINIRTELGDLNSQTDTLFAGQA